jgi:hypothetical protein
MAMNTNWTRGLSLVGLLLASTATTQANDIVDFLRAISGNSGRRNSPVVVQPVGGRGHGQNHAEHGHGPTVGGPGSHRHPARTVNLRSGNYVTPQTRSALRGNLRFAVNGQLGTGYASPVYIPAQRPVQVLPPVQAYPPVPVYQQSAPSPFEPGQFVNCQVPLATCVRVKDECRIAPNAVPVVIAVRDPNSCAHDDCERLVFVQIFVPPCPLLNLRVSRGGTRISLDYGQYEVGLKSVNGLVVIDYDN